MIAMIDAAGQIDPNERTILHFEVSDEALEAAATPRSGAAMSLPSAPTVSILVMCCGSDNEPAR
jgi:hypothetical protein